VKMLCINIVVVLALITKVNRRTYFDKKFLCNVCQPDRIESVVVFPKVIKTFTFIRFCKLFSIKINSVG
jgi:hypothetical protein